MEKVINTLHNFGFGSLDLTEDDFLDPNQVIQIGQSPFRVDFLTSISGVSFEEAWSNKITGNYGSQSVNFI